MQEVLAIKAFVSCVQIHNQITYVLDVYIQLLYNYMVHGAMISSLHSNVRWQYVNAIIHISDSQQD